MSEIRRDGKNGPFDLIDESGAHTTTDTLRRANLYANAELLLQIVKHYRGTLSPRHHSKRILEIDAVISKVEKK